MKISEHFTLLEATKSQTAIRLGIDNTPNEDFIIANLKRTAQYILEPVRNHYGIPFAPSSMYRCRELNRALGSKDSSQHRTGQAVDLEVPGVSNLELAHWMAEHCDYDQLLLEFFDGTPTGGWVHGSFVSPDDNRKQILTITKSGVTLGLPTLG